MLAEHCQIRRAAAADIQAIHEVHMASIRGLCREAYTPEQIEKWTSNPDLKRYAPLVTPRFHCLVATDAAGLHAFGTLDLEKSEISSLFVRPDYAGAGLGGLLLRRLETVASERGFAALELESSVNACRFYSKHGYQTLHPARKRFSSGLEIECVRMRKEL